MFKNENQTLVIAALCVGARNEIWEFSGNMDFRKFHQLLENRNTGIDRESYIFTMRLMSALRLLLTLQANRSANGEF